MIDSGKKKGRGLKPLDDIQILWDRVPNVVPIYQRIEFADCVFECIDAFEQKINHILELYKVADESIGFV